MEVSQERPQQRCRCRCPSHICGTDIDDLFAYTATKSVTIRDHRLGMLHYFLLFCIAVYIIVYQLIANLGYLKFSDAKNSARLSLQQPTDGCNPNKPTCKDSFASLSHLNYCCAQNASCRSSNSDSSCMCDYRPAFKNYNCTYLDGAEASVVQQSSILATTSIHQYKQSLNKSCFANVPAGEGACGKVWLVDADVVAFTADVEAYTVLIDHVVMGPGLSALSFASREMEGVLYVSEGELQEKLCAGRKDATASPFGGRPTDHSPCYLRPKQVNGLDYFTVGELLQAMGVSLDVESYAGSGHSARYDGMVANLIIEYSNTENWRGTLPKPRYIYKAAAVPQSDYEYPMIVSTSFPDERVKWAMKGLLLEVQAGGRLATFNFTQLLLQLTTSLTLLAMAAVAVNFLAQQVLQHKKFYRLALNDNTANFEKIHRVQNEILQNQNASFTLDELLRQRSLPRGGTRAERVMRLLEDDWAGEIPADISAAEAVEPAQQAQSSGEAAGSLA